MWYPPYDVFSVLGPFPLRTRVNVVPHFPSVRCFFRTRVNMVTNYHISGRSGLISRWNGYPSVRCFFRTKLNVVLLPNGMGPYSFRGRVKVVPLRTMFFPY